ncbi:SDH family Clp fold serine proteinase [Shinella granuli]|uniref:SDH family Clp fold serine proteinase n=1 Tax=Shinella granuli TaxID=323621 RepID=UPI003CD0A4C0
MQRGGHKWDLQSGSALRSDRTRTKYEDHLVRDGRQGERRTQIGPDCIDILRRRSGRHRPTKKISLLLHTNGGNTAAAWRLVNLIKTFCDEFEVLIPYKAMSAGTLISLGAQSIVMTKQAALGPIDPSLIHPLGPQVRTVINWPPFRYQLRPYEGSWTREG